MMKRYERRYSISEVSETVDAPIHQLRRWEKRFPQLKPKRDRNGRRYYLEADIEVARRIKQLLRHEQMTSGGARKKLDQELHGEGAPQTRQEAIELIDRMEETIRRMLDLLDGTT